MIEEQWKATKRQVEWHTLRTQQANEAPKTYRYDGLCFTESDMIHHHNILPSVTRKRAALKVHFRFQKLFLQKKKKQANLSLLCPRTGSSAAWHPQKHHWRRGIVKHSFCTVINNQFTNFQTKKWLDIFSSPDRQDNKQSLFIQATFSR